MTGASLFSVAGGKYHKPSGPAVKPWRPTETVCGLTVTPLNYFACDEDANRHTGGRLALYLCKHCARAAQ